MLEVIGHTVDEMKQLGPEAIVTFIRNVPTLNVEAALATRQAGLYTNLTDISGVYK